MRKITKIIVTGIPVTIAPWPNIRVYIFWRNCGWNPCINRTHFTPWKKKQSYVARYTHFLTWCIQLTTFSCYFLTVIAKLRSIIMEVDPKHVLEQSYHNTYGGIVPMTWWQCCYSRIIVFPRVGRPCTGIFPNCRNFCQ